MRRLFPITAIAVAVPQGIGMASADDLPTYELHGFPITTHQFSVVGSADVHEAAPVPTLMFGGMPASPHQIAVLTPRKRIIEQSAEKPKPTAVGFAAKP